MAGPTRTEADAYREQVRVLSQALPAAVSITDVVGKQNSVVTPSRFRISTTASAARIGPSLASLGRA